MDSTINFRKIVSINQKLVNIHKGEDILTFRGELSGDLIDFVLITSGEGNDEYSIFCFLLNFYLISIVISPKSLLNIIIYVIIM
jgi:hypothetical protein